MGRETVDSFEEFVRGRWLLGCGVGTVKSQRSRALKRLRDLAGVSPSFSGGFPVKVQECHD